MKDDEFAIVVVAPKLANKDRWNSTARPRLRYLITRQNQWQDLFSQFLHAHAGRIDELTLAVFDRPVRTCVDRRDGALTESHCTSGAPVRQ